MVRVIVRPHPESSSSHLVIDQESKGRNNIVSLRFPERKSRSYTVNQALSPQTTQSQLFHQALETPLEQWLTHGRPGALFAYGFTGTGKSYSLFGTPENPGGIWLTAHYLLEHMPAPKDDCKLRVSMYEVDGKQVKDLLGDGADLTVRVDEQGSVHLRKANGGPLTRVVLGASEEFQVLWEQAQRSRRVGSSTTHDASSRTHAVVDLEIVDDRVIELEGMVEVKHAEYIQISNNKDAVLLSEIKEAYQRDGPTATINGRPLDEVVREHGLPHEESLLALSEARKNLDDYKQNAETAALRGSFSIIDMAGNGTSPAHHVAMLSSTNGILCSIRVRTRLGASRDCPNETGKEGACGHKCIPLDCQGVFPGHDTGKATCSVSTILLDPDPQTLSWKQQRLQLRHVSYDFPWRRRYFNQTNNEYATLRIVDCHKRAGLS